MLYEWTTNPKDKAYMTDFSTIREKALYKWQERLHYWQVPAVIIAALQAVIFAFALEPLFRSYGVPRFIFACANHNWTALYLLSSAIISSGFRFVMWQLSEHELVSVYALSNRAKASLRHLIDNVPQHERRSTLTELPPSYPPLISTIRSIPQRIAGNVQHDHPRDAHWQPVKDYVQYFAAIFHTPIGTMKSGFINTKASPRWRPLVILLHLSTVGRPQIKTLFTGFIEAVLLLILTFFFASQWGGNLYITMLALSMLLIFVTLGRALALVYVWFSARIWGLHVINCDEEEEIRGCMRILCSMEDALVIVNGAHYYNGHRLDFIGGAFRRWKNEYSRGLYDGDFSQEEEEAASSPNTERSGLRKDEILNESKLV
ncbi:hypothetical protein B0O99DRAFT_641798 [Bisporella sp. PMI_857]|nr:hypothetical protein B0O99DRAFT_641798 [Bisporella sp. PMI_857]